MKRTAMMMAMAMVVSAGITRAGQESVAVGPASPVQGGKVMKAKSMTAVGAVKTVAAESLVERFRKTNLQWLAFVGAAGPNLPIAWIGRHTIGRAGQETLDVAPVSPVEGGKVMPSKPGAGQETLDVAPVSPVHGGEVIPSKPLMITEIKEGQRVQVNYHNVNGKMHATQVRVM